MNTVTSLPFHHQFDDRHRVGTFLCSYSDPITFNSHNEASAKSGRSFNFYLSCLLLVVMLISAMEQVFVPGKLAINLTSNQTYPYIMNSSGDTVNPPAVERFFCLQQTGSQCEGKGGPHPEL